MRWLLIVDYRGGGNETFQVAERQIVDEFLAAYNGSWWFQEISIVPARVVRKFQIANFQIEPAPPNNASGAMVPALGMRRRFGIIRLVCTTTSEEQRESNDRLTTSR